jgi:SAM-dependent MidA family methyltransferase
MASAELRDLLRGRIAAEGPLDFAAFMAEALYHPEHGYYARGTGQVGKAGDFFTSVSVGPVFGKLLARRFLQWWLDAGAPSVWRIIECGAHDGTLAADVLGGLRDLSPSAFAALEYAIPEPLARLRAAQASKLEAFGGKVLSLDGADDLADRPLPGVAFGNEVIDALPCQVIERRGGAWHLCRVAWADGGFRWLVAEPLGNGDLGAAAAALGDGFPDGYRTEIRTRESLRRFLKPLLAGLDRGLMLWIDYGFARPEFHHPARTAGTLRAFRSHRVEDDPLSVPGTADLTAHVEFTGLAEAAASLGARPIAFRDQGTWLTHLARPWLLEMEDNPDSAAIRQFRTLVHPAHLGARFHVLELAWQDDHAPELPATDRHRLALDG